MRKIIVLALLLFLVGCIQPADPGAAMNDTIKINYKGTHEDGTVFDTNIQSVAEEADIYNEQRPYEPMEAVIGQKRFISGFENALIGMRVGEAKTIEISPEEGYGPSLPEKILTLNVSESIPREMELDRIITVPLAEVKKLGAEDVYDEFSIGDVDYEIMDIVEDMATLEIEVKEGDELLLPNTAWNSTVIEITEDKYTVRQDPKNGALIQTAYGPVKIFVSTNFLTRKLLMEEGAQIMTPSGPGTVTSVDDKYVVIDFNHPLAGKTIIFEIERVE